MKPWLLCFFMLLALSQAYSKEQLLTKPWFVIFLDIDGVLYQEPNRSGFYEEKRQKLISLFGQLDHYSVFQRGCATAHYFDLDAVDRLDSFIDQMSADYQVGIVLSSAWRETLTLEEIHQVFSPWNFSKIIIDKTPEEDYYFRDIEDQPSSLSLRKYGFSLKTRGDQIDFWLREHAGMNIAHFVIFDDIDDGLSTKFSSQFIHVPNRLLSQGDILEALEHIQPAAFDPPESPETLAMKTQERPLNFTFTCFDTPANRDAVTKTIAALYADFLRPLSNDHALYFADYLQQELQNRLQYLPFIRLYPENQGALAFALRRMQISPNQRLIPSHSISYIEKIDNLLRICINLEPPPLIK